jgi:hypothetical protein
MFPGPTGLALDASFSGWGLSDRIESNEAPETTARERNYPYKEISVHYVSCARNEISAFFSRFFDSRVLR